MKKEVYIGALNDSITINHNAFFGSMGVEYRGQKLRKKEYDYSYEVITAKGDKVAVALRRKLIGLDAPELFIDGVFFPYLKPLTIIDKILAFLPFGMVLLGAIGGLFAAITTLGVLTVCRSVEDKTKSSIINVFMIIAAYIITVYVIRFIVSFI